MSMSLHHPSLSMNGKKKGKVKFRNADEARRARELDESWNTLQKKWGVDKQDKKRKQAKSAEPLSYKLDVPNGRSTSNHIPSRNTGEIGAVTYKPSPQYTGNEVLGISQMAKSNAVPVFNSDHIVEIARMRR